MFREFTVVPAVDLQDGQAVQLVGGERDTGTRYGDPVEAARGWLDAGAETLHIVDLDGAFDGERENADAIEDILTVCAEVGKSRDGNSGVDVQLGGGIRSATEATDLLRRGVDRVILGTAAVETPSLVSDVANPSRVMVSLDASDGEVVVSGWTEETGLDPAEAAGRYESLGAGAVLFTDVDREGRMEGVRTDPLERVVRAVDIPVVASGGVSSLADIRALRDAGAAAVVVGTALYEGRFTLAETQQL